MVVVDREPEIFVQFMIGAMLTVFAELVVVVPSVDALVSAGVVAFWHPKTSIPTRNIENISEK
jgi:hypothetical protein